MRPEDRTGRRARTVFFGSGTFGLAVLEAALDVASIDLVAVVSTPDRPAGRGRASVGTPVAARARELGLPLLQPPRLRDADAVEAVATLRPEMGLLADYGQIVPARLVNVPPHGILNVHPSLLPRHRGASPIPGAILAGDPETGVTLMRMDAGLDTGPVIAAVRHGLDGRETTPQLEMTLAAMVPGLLRESVPAWLEGRIHAVAQDERLATLTRPLRRGDGRLDPARPAAELERQVRAFQPWPGSFVEAGGVRVIVWAARVLDGSDASTAPGTLVGRSHGLGLVTAGGVLELIEVQPAGGRRMSGAELVRGRPGLIGTIVDTGSDRSVEPPVG